jgi:hypothetical protein
VGLVLAAGLALPVTDVLGAALTLDGSGKMFGGVLTVERFGEALLELAALPELLGLGEGEGDGEGDGDGDGEGDGEGDGVGVPEAGSAWHTVSVLMVVARGAAAAVPSTPKVRKLPLSTVTAATLTCAKRIRIACLRCSSGLPCALRDSEATRDRMGTGTHFR